MSKSSKQRPLAEGELFAYLAGESLPHVAQQLNASPALQQDFDELRQLDHWLQHNFGGIARPDPQDLVDVALGQANATQKLIVAAYVRQSRQGQRELKRLQKEFGGAAVTAPPTKRPLLFWAIPLLGGAGLKTEKGGASASLAANHFAQTRHGGEQTFQVTELQAQITIRIPPASGETWQLSGIVTQNQQPMANATVTLRAEHTRPRPRKTDQMGFFAFRHLPEGTYRLRVYLDQGIVRVPDIELSSHSNPIGQ